MDRANHDKVLLLGGDSIAAYGFGEGHPFGPDRYQAFVDGLAQSGLASDAVEWRTAAAASRGVLTRFHDPAYVDFVEERCLIGSGFLDGGDTPAAPGLFESASAVAGAALAAADAIMKGEFRQAFVPIAGLHHARRDGAAGFCVFNDCGIVAESLLGQHGLERVAYVDIDAHHGDGVYYGFETNPALIFADLHEDGRFLYPGTGAAHENGSGEAAGTKLNIPLAPGTRDDAFLEAWSTAEEFVRSHDPQFIILQCGADSVAGDPITHMACTPAAHAHVAARLKALAGEVCDGRILALGGGGYNRANLAAAWSGVVSSLANVQGS